jgi:hypothetical protein
MLKYKLTNQDNTTRNNTLWGEGVTHETDGSGELCGPGWLHFYHTPELAVMMNPAHADIEKPKLWECEAEGQFLDDHGLKGGCTKLTTLREIPLPDVTLEQRIRFGILCAQKAFGGKSELWDEWATGWLSGSDRSLESARAAEYAAEYAAYAAAYAAASYTSADAHAASAAYSADAASAAYSADAARNAAYAVSAAADAWAARADAVMKFDLQAIALQALQGN